MDGYATEGLEMWAYPFEVFNNYRLAFLISGTTTPVNAEGVLRRVEYRPDSMTRVYVGVDFVVHERIFVPLNSAGAIVTYSVQSRRGLEILVHADPVMNLMWPAAVGGQQVAWNGAAPGFVLSDAQDHYTAVIGSPEIAAHDDSGNRTFGGLSETGFGFTLHPGKDGKASVYVALSTPHDADPLGAFHKLVQDREALKTEYSAHVEDVTGAMVKLTTPDARVNDAFAWSELAVDEAWVCNRDLGCGYVAGYGPSRGARRPQYDWFFGGDGSIAADAAVSDGHTEQARAELEFILHYQDHKTGMIWHELSQSAGFLDWVGKYPYMFVHVDVTSQFLGTVGRYVKVTGDVAFLREHWQQLEAAYRFCTSLLAANGLPHIPANKEGGDEQDRMSEDLGLSASWVAATDAFAKMAELTQHPELSRQAKEANQRARSAIQSRYWDAASNFWIQGYTDAGRAMEDRRSSPALALTLHLFSPDREDLLLQQLSGADFETDWGTRGIGSESKGFEPGSYGKGSVSALGTSELATAFWGDYRPVQALSMWRALLPWFSLDSLGHMHEVLAGDVYRAQEESVPEQTWSSAGFVDVTLHGLLGLQVDALAREIVFAPHLPAEWHDVALSNVALGQSKVSFNVQQSASQVSLKIDNSGEPFDLRFNPQLALGAGSKRALFNGKVVAVRLDDRPEESIAQMLLHVPHGASELQLEVSGGVAIEVPSTAPLLGETSDAIHLVDARLEGDSLRIIADVATDAHASLVCESSWPLNVLEGASVETIRPGVVRLHFKTGRATAAGNGYQRVQARVAFKR
jgi:glycogen debranching enzyme